ncbi:MAG: hypothetical protein ACXAEN_26105, partial [Candidatus Thorarchaeota archaeon]
MAKWQEYVLSCFPKNEFYEVPKEWIVPGNAMHRFASYDALVHDTMKRNGPIAPACLSLLFRPKVIVEMGVHVGWTT